VLSGGYQYRFNSEWSVGISIGGVVDIPANNRTDFSNIIGFDLGLETRYRFGGRPERPLGVFMGFEVSRAYADRPYAIESTTIEGVAKVIETKVVARRAELNFGLHKTWIFRHGFTVDARLGVGVNAYSWTTADKSVELAPVIPSFLEDEGSRAFRNEPNTRTSYFAPRARIGLGWSF